MADKLVREIRVVHDPHDQILKREFVLVGNVQHRLEPFVPEAHSIKESDRGDRRHRDGQHDFVENINVVCPVDFGGFRKRFVNRFEKIPHQKHVPWADERGNNQHPDRIPHSQVLGDEQVVRHKSAMEKHREVNVKVDPVFEFQGANGQRIRKRACHQHGERRADNGDEDRHPIGSVNRVILEYQIIGSQREFARKNRITRL